MKFSIKDFFSKCDQISSFMQIWSHLPRKSLMESSFFVKCISVFVLHQRRSHDPRKHPRWRVLQQSLTVFGSMLSITALCPFWCYILCFRTFSLFSSVNVFINLHINYAYVPIFEPLSQGI